jgi:transcriptional regulator with XRE-family HTH domain
MQKTKRGRSAVDKPSRPKAEQAILTGNFLFMLRERKGLTQAQVATEINSKHGTKLDGTTVSNWENGAQFPSRYLRKLGVFYNVSVDDLYRGQQDEPAGGDVNTKTLGRIFSDTELAALSAEQRYHLAGLLLEGDVDDAVARSIVMLLVASKKSAARKS